MENSCYVFKMEDLDVQLLLAKIEVSYWKDQLKQAVSQLRFTNTLHAIQSISIESLENQV